MTGTSASACSDKTGKNNKGLPLARVKDEFASSSKGNNSMKIEHELLKKNHETLKIAYARLQERVKLTEETYEDCLRERSEKDKYKKLFEETKTVESERKATIDELRRREEELLMATRREEELLMARMRSKEDAAELENKFFALAERFSVIEADCSYFESLYDAEVAASKTGETENLIGHEGNNYVNNHVKNNATDSIMISDESDDEHVDPPRESNIITQRSFSASSSSSSSSSLSSDGYDVVFKLPANWPEWAIPKGPGDDSNKS